MNLTNTRTWHNYRHNVYNGLFRNNYYRKYEPITPSLLTLLLSAMSSEAPQTQIEADPNSSTKSNKNNIYNMQKITKTIVTSPNIYKPVGPYSQAVLADKTLYISGVLGMNIEAKMVSGGAEGQTRQALDNLRHVLEAGGASLESVVKTTVLLANMDDFQVVNKVYAEYFQKNCPARATYQVARLPLGAAVEIEAVALSGDLVVAEAPCPCART